MSGILQTIIQRKALCFGFVTLGIFVALAVLAPWIAPYDPVVDADLMVASTPPGADRQAAISGALALPRLRSVVRR